METDWQVIIIIMKSRSKLNQFVSCPSLPTVPDRVVESVSDSGKRPFPLCNDDYGDEMADFIPTGQQEGRIHRMPYHTEEWSGWWWMDQWPDSGIRLVRE